MCRSAGEAGPCLGTAVAPGTPAPPQLSPSYHALREGQHANTPPVPASFHVFPFRAPLKQTSPNIYELPGHHSTCLTVLPLNLLSSGHCTVSATVYQALGPCHQPCLSSNSANALAAGPLTSASRRPSPPLPFSNPIKCTSLEPQQRNFSTSKMPFCYLSPYSASRLL